MKPLIRVTGQRGVAIIFKRTFAMLPYAAHGMCNLPEFEIVSKSVDGARGMFANRTDAVKHAMDAVGGPCELEEI